MNTPIERIRLLIKYLPKSDIHLGYDFLQARDFESLKDLVDSAIIRIKKSLRSETPKEEYINIDINKLNRLQSEVDTYQTQLEIIEVDSDYDEDCEVEEDEDYY